MKLHLGPRQCGKQNFVLYPLVCGSVLLPKLRLVAYPDTPEAMSLENLLEQILPDQILVMVRLYTFFRLR